MIGMALCGEEDCLHLNLTLMPALTCIRFLSSTRGVVDTSLPSSFLLSPLALAGSKIKRRPRKEREKERKKERESP